MTLQEIKNAVDSGKKVYWQNVSYQVVKSNLNYLIKCLWNGSCIGLTWDDEVTMNGKEQDFYILEIMLVTPEFIGNVIENRKPIGRFYAKEGDRWVSCHNLTGDAWTEDFATEQEAIDELT